MSANDPVPTLEQVETAERVLKFIEDNPQLHDQKHWLLRRDTAHPDLYNNFEDWSAQSIRAAFVPEPSCGTTGCFAGWLAADQQVPIYYAQGNVQRAMVVVNDVDGKYGMDIQDWAAERLGLPGMSEYGWPTREHHMFDERSTLEDLREWVADIRTAYGCGITVDTVRRERRLHPVDA